MLLYDDTIRDIVSLTDVTGGKAEVPHVVWLVPSLVGCR